MSSPTVTRLDPSTGWTCLACKLVFSSGQLQRDHYRSEWHLYNMKRQIAALPPVSERDFLEKLQHFSLHQQQQFGNVGAANDENNRFSVVGFAAGGATTASSPLSNSASSITCTVCPNKRFRSHNAFNSHLQSRRHKEAAAAEQHHQQEEEQVEQQQRLQQHAPAALALDADGKAAESVDEAEMVKTQTHGADTDGEAKQQQKDGIPFDECLFCEHSKFGTWQTNLEHMTAQHGFMVPDLPFCTDVPALLIYLGFKIGVGLTCIRCQSARFRSLDALRKHMRDSNHCNFRIDSQQEDGDVLLEFMDFYDYGRHPQFAGAESEDACDDEDDDTEEGEEGVVQTLDAVLSDEGAFLVLPSGARIGHRSLVRYFRQRLGYSSSLNSWTRLAIGPQKSCNAVVLESQIKEIRARARDVSFMKRTVARYRLKRELASNKLFRSRGRSDQQ